MMLRRKDKTHGDLKSSTNKDMLNQIKKVWRNQRAMTC